MRKRIFSFLAVLFFSTGCSAPTAILNHNLRDFSPSIMGVTSIQLQNYFFIPYMGGVAVKPGKSHEVFFEMGNNADSFNYRFNVFHEKNIYFSTGVGISREEKGGANLGGEEKDEEDVQKIPANTWVELPLTVTVKHKNLFGWVSLKPGMVKVEDYDACEDSYSCDDEEAKHYSPGLLNEFTMGWGFGYLSPNGFYILFASQNSFVKIEGPAEAGNLFSILVGYTLYTE